MSTKKIRPTEYDLFFVSMLTNHSLPTRPAAAADLLMVRLPESDR